MTDSSSSRELLDRACLLGKMGRYEQAEVLIKQYLSIDPKCAEAYALLSLIYGYTQRIELSSIETARQAVALDPNNSYNYFILTIAYQSHHLPNRAEQSIATAIERNPQVAYYFAHQAEVYIDQNRWQEAIESTKRGLEIDPEEVLCLKLQVTALLKLRSFTEATETTNTLLSLYPNDADVHRLLGNLCLKKNEIQQAITAYQESLRLNPLQPSIQELVRYQTARLKRLQTAKPKQYSTVKEIQYKNKFCNTGVNPRVTSSDNHHCLKYLYKSILNVLQKLAK
jgi:tetratricopeptide (TPR) repeat protein